MRDWDEMKSIADLKLSARVALARWKLMEATHDKMADYEFACLLVDLAEDMKEPIRAALLQRLRDDINEALGPIPQPGQGSP